MGFDHKSLAVPDPCDKATCDGCGKVEVFPHILPTKQSDTINWPACVKTMQEKGWFFGGRRNRLLCPNCKTGPQTIAQTSETKVTPDLLGTQPETPKKRRAHSSVQAVNDRLGVVRKMLLEGGPDRITIKEISLRTGFSINTSKADILALGWTHDGKVAIPPVNAEPEPIVPTQAQRRAMTAALSVAYDIGGQTYHEGHTDATAAMAAGVSESMLAGHRDASYGPAPVILPPVDLEQMATDYASLKARVESYITKRTAKRAEEDAFSQRMEDEVAAFGAAIERARLSRG
jgi:hypothetical protein